MATLSSILDRRVPFARGAWWAIVHGVAKCQTQLSMHTQIYEWEIQFYYPLIDCKNKSSSSLPYTVTSGVSPSRGGM